MKVHVLNNKIFQNILIKSLILILLVWSILTPWITNGQFNKDVVMFSNMFVNDINKEPILDFILHNTISILLLRNIFFFIPTKFFFILIHNFSVLLLTYVLLKHLKIKYFLILFLLLFYPIFFNQFRESLSLSFGIMAYKLYKVKINKSILLLFLAVLFHYFAVFFVISVILYEIFFTRDNRYKKIVIVLSLAILFAFFLLYNYNSRYHYYINSDTFTSYMFLILAFFLFLFWESLIEYKIGYFFLNITFFAMLISSMASLSSRVVEITLVFLFLSSSYSLKKYPICKAKWKEFLTFTMAIIFFMYRFINIFILDQHIRSL